MRYLVCYASVNESRVKVIAEFRNRKDAIEYRDRERQEASIVDLNTYKVIGDAEYNIEELTKFISEEDAKNIIAIHKELNQRVEMFARRYDQ